MKADRESMDLALKEKVVPALRAAGFKGSMPHMRRIKPDAVDLLTFQFDKWGGGFVIEISRGTLNGFTTHWGLHIPAAKLKAHDLHPNQRHRIRARKDLGTDSDAWFRFDRDPVAVVAQQVLNALPEAESWWQAKAQQSVPEDAFKATRL